MSKKIDIRFIITDHIDTLRDYSQENDPRSWWDITFFFVLPLLVALVLAYCVTPSESMRNILVNAFAIFAALLLSLLVLVIDAIKRIKESHSDNKWLLKLLNQTYANITYAVLVSVAGVIILFIPYLWQTWDKHLKISFVISTVIFYIVINFMLTLLMILKRMHAISVEMNNTPNIK